jgi:predicted aldo/keto reductase-like oxidoreductase
MRRSSAADLMNRQLRNLRADYLDCLILHSGRAIPLL